MKKQRIAALLLTLALLLGLVACESPAVVEQDDILSQRITPSDKIPITVLVKYAFSINTFEAALEKKFPQIDLIQVGNYTSNMGIAEYEARLEHDDLTDLVMTWPLDVGEDYWDDRLMELSTLPLTERYLNSMLEDIARDGKLYYLPGPSQLRGIVYNKTLFEERGWALPTDFDSFVALCQEIERSGLRSLQLGLGNEEVLDTAFVGFGYSSSFSTPQNARMLSEFNQGNGSFADNFTPALETFQELVDAGILKPSDLTVTYSDRERMIFTRACAMVEDSVLLARMGEGYNGCTDEFALMPFFNPSEDADWARLYPVCYIGVSKQMEQEENKEKRELILQMLDYISTPEGQLALAGDTGGMFSSLKGVIPPDIPEIEALLPALSHGRYAIFPTLKNAQSALRKGLAGMVEGTMTAAEVSKAVDAENKMPPTEEAPRILGKASEDFNLMETGSFMTDTMRAYSGCDIALFLDVGKDGLNNGKGISGKIYKGDITEVDLDRILPDLKMEEKGELLKITMTGEDLLQTLEYTISVNNDRDGWFYYFSGLKMEYAPAAAHGSRIRSIQDEAGNDIVPDQLYSIAVMDESVPEEFVKSSESVGLLLRDMLTQELAKQGEISPSKDGRFVVAAP